MWLNAVCFVVAGVGAAWLTRLLALAHEELARLNWLVALMLEADSQEHAHKIAAAFASERAERRRPWWRPW